MLLRLFKRADDSAHPHQKTNFLNEKSSFYNSWEKQFFKKKSCYIVTLLQSYIASFSIFLQYSYTLFYVSKASVSLYL